MYIYIHIYIYMYTRTHMHIHIYIYILSSRGTCSERFLPLSPLLGARLGLKALVLTISLSSLPLSRLVERRPGRRRWQPLAPRRAGKADSQGLRRTILPSREERERSAKINRVVVRTQLHFLFFLRLARFPSLALTRSLPRRPPPP